MSIETKPLDQICQAAAAFEPDERTATIAAGGRMPRREHAGIPMEIPVEIPIEQISYVPGPRADHAATVRRWWAATQQRADASTAVRTTPTSSASGSRAVVGGGAKFRRLVDVPGARLEPALLAWWRRASHDDGHLRLDWLSGHDGVFELEGSFRTSPLTRRVPVDMQLTPYVTRWSLLELAPRRPTRPSRRYFDTGHASLDRFAAALREQV